MASDEVTTKFLTFKAPSTKDETLKFINTWINHYQKNGLDWVIELKENHKVIGVISGDKSYKYRCIELVYPVIILIKV